MRVVEELSYRVTKPMTLHSDNQGAIELTKNPLRNDRSKHIHVRHHYVRQQVEAKSIRVFYCKTEDMIADILTKPLDRVKHQRFVTLLGMK